MGQTQKQTPPIGAGNVLPAVYNGEDKSITTSGFLVGKVGRKITQSISTTTIANDTLTFTYLEDGNTLYSIKVIYTDGTREVMLSAERIA